MANAKLQPRPSEQSRKPRPIAPFDAQALLTKALADHQAGRRAEARAAYEAVLAQQPNNFNALQFLGVLLHQEGQSDAGLNYLSRAVALQPLDAILRNNYGGVLREAGHFEAAEKQFAQAIAIMPDYPAALANHGATLHGLERYDESEKSLRALIALDPNHADCLRQLAHIAATKERHADAEAWLRRYVALRPDNAEELCNLACAVQRQGRDGEALPLFHQALKVAETTNPALAQNLWGLLGMRDESPAGREAYRQKLRDTNMLWVSELTVAANLMLGGQRDSASSIIEDILTVHADDWKVFNDTATIYLGLGKYAEAEPLLRRAIALAPNEPAPHSNLGGNLLHLNRADEAIHEFQSALRHDPSNITAQVDLTRALRQMAQYDKAHIFGRAALDMPTYKIENMPMLLQLFKGLCDFDALDRLGDVWEGCGAQSITHLTAMFLDLLVFARTPEETRKFVDLTKKWADMVSAQARRAPLLTPRKASPEGRLRIGILSSDLRSHSVSRFLRPFVLNHDKSKISLHAYTPYRHQGDAVQEMFKKACDKFVFVDGMNEREIAEQIRDDSVDILLELNGFTQGTRIGALAYKPAPVQMSWLGYPFTSGLKAIDYVVMDRFVVPDDETTLVEQALVMPDAWVCFGKFPEIEINPTLPMDRNGFVTFGTLNNPYKYNREVIAAWAAVMNRVPGSRMLFVRPESSSMVLIRNLTEEFAKHGVSGDRLYFFDNRAEKRNHLEYYNEIDISLDSFPLTGGTTTCEATWMGVPVVSLVGEAFHQRISYSALMHCGLQELCTFNIGDFVERAVALTGERDKLVAWRTDLREIMRASPLCDEDRFLHQFQDMLEQVADLHSLR